ncbi:adenosylcobinamide amidohydrolase [Halogeometricum borinquense]|uniref:Adenosylcobinamide amidohydrolase n=1 Tax=Halogeometricum borinquense TaxID=60847 RepID=A0A6C0UHH1_9EURY|nr:adenosylcobinamide amidohydrolase [Halogeometricum borinquense]QIB73249.1 adenosylcobinamide amidohydrolase [Halogeometricum borinquense]QIQ77354.1 adenosylcobinamide amidohydrolase [Halogeometricum borinquense]
MLPPVFDATVRDDVLQLSRPETRWLSTGHAGGKSRGPVAYNVSVPEGWDEMDVDGYVERRLDAAGFDEEGPTLLTGVSMRHARRARLGPVEVVATAGVSNPAALPVADSTHSTAHSRTDEPPAGTVNVFVGTTRDLAAGALANLIAVAAEAKTATLLAQTGFPGTTTDAIIAACDPAGETTLYSGSATEVGAATRACVRDALCASLESRYSAADGNEIPDSVEDAKYGVVTDERAAVSQILTDENDGEAL